jgi:hypothetical protein
MPRAGYKPPPRYSKVTRRMWNDEKFRRLSAPGPNAQFLWMRLLTGPELTVIPGVFSIGEAGLAEALRWPMEGFREAFRELLAEGIVEADWNARLIWVPRSLEHNKPESPNVVLGWALAWSEMPECPLKRKAYQGLEDGLRKLPPSFLEAFREACGNSSGNQEQEQEQEQDNRSDLRRGSPPAPASPAAAMPLKLEPQPPLIPASTSPLLEYLAIEFTQANADVALERAWAAACPAINLLAEAKKARAWELSNPRKVAKMKRSFLRSWFDRAHETERKSIAPAGGGGSRRTAFVPLTKTKERFEKAGDDDEFGLNLKPVLESAHG